MKTTILIMALVTLTACGIKGPPLPPLREETIQTQKAQAVAAPAAVSQDNSKAKQKKMK